MSATLEVKTTQTREPYESTVFRQVEHKLSRPEARLFGDIVARYQKNRPDIEGSDYSEEEKQLDSVRLRHRQSQAKQNTEIEKVHYIQAKIFEAVLSEIMELHWLPGSFITETSDFDDWINGVDAVLELSTDRGAILDFTSQEDPDKIKRKIETIFERIERGEMGEAKYFRSQVDGKNHHLKMLPMVVVGLSHKTVTELIELYASGKKKELENHWVRYALAGELLAQIDIFQKYINNVHRRGYSAAPAQKMNQAYEDLRRVVAAFQQKISQGEKIDQLIKQRLAAVDPIYKNIMAAVS